MSPRRFPPPWSVEETAPCIVRDANGQALGSRRIAANIAKLPEL
jgi:hypothetical protein